MTTAPPVPQLWNYGSRLQPRKMRVDFGRLSRNWNLNDAGKTNENRTTQESKDLVVFDIVRDSACAECRKELLARDFLFLEDGRPLCLACADFDHLGDPPSVAGRHALREVSETWFEPYL